MKIERESKPPVIIGKRITVGAAILAVSEALQFFFPAHAPAIGQLAVPVIFVVQTILVNRYGITQ